MTAIDPWFLTQIREMVDLEDDARGRVRWRPLRARRCGGPSATASPTIALARLWNAEPLAVRARRKELGVTAVFNRVDTCAAEFESFTPYLYSSYESRLRGRARRTARRS